MRAVQIVRPGELKLLEIPKPVTDDKNNVLVRMTAAGICGSDMGIYHGTNAAATYPRIIGHEMVGVVEETGPEVKDLKPGDRVIINQVISRGTCYPCRMGRGNVKQGPGPGILKAVRCQGKRRHTRRNHPNGKEAPARLFSHSVSSSASHSAADASLGIRLVGAKSAPLRFRLTAKPPLTSLRFLSPQDLPILRGPLLWATGSPLPLSPATPAPPSRGRRTRRWASASRRGGTVPRSPPWARPARSCA